MKIDLSAAEIVVMLSTVETAIGVNEEGLHDGLGIDTDLVYTETAILRDVLAKLQKGINL